MSEASKVQTVTGTGTLFDAQGLKRFDAELWLAKRLQNHLAAVFNGLTDPDVRKARIRRCILTAELEDTIVGTNALGKTETYSQAFERLYSEPLKPKGK